MLFFQQNVVLYFNHDKKLIVINFCDDVTDFCLQLTIVDVGYIMPVMHGHMTDIVMCLTSFTVYQLVTLLELMFQN